MVIIQVFLFANIQINSITNVKKQNNYKINASKRTGRGGYGSIEKLSFNPLCGSANIMCKSELRRACASIMLVRMTLDTHTVTSDN